MSSNVFRTISIRGQDGPIVDFTLTDNSVGQSKDSIVVSNSMMDLSDESTAEDEGYTQEFKCDNCYKSFARFRELKKHLVLCQLNSSYHLRKAEMLENIDRIEEDAINMEKDNICFCCGESYDTSHLGPINCSDCAKSFQTQMGYERHIFITHSESDEFPCSTCNAKLRTANLLKLHEGLHKNREEKRVSCDYCEKKFPSLSALKDHRRSHTGEKPYSCTECKQSFSVKESLNRHMRRHTGEKPFTCSECNQSFSHQNTLKCHMTRHTGEKIFTCTECNQGFAVKHALKYHMRRHTGEKPYSCTECNQSFALKHALNRHMMRHTGERPYKCIECNQSFTAKRSLNDHMTRHTGEKPYTCNECNKSFSIKSSLYHHMKRHTVEKPHVCNDCGKRFIRALNLHYHSKTHIRPFACDQCEEKFKTKKELEQHIRVHSSKNEGENEAKELKFKCEECKTIYATEEDLKTHYDMKVHKTEYTSKRFKEIMKTRTTCAMDITTINNVTLPLKFEKQTSMEDVVPQNISKDEVIESSTETLILEDKEPDILTLENKSIKTEPEHVVHHKLIGEIIDNQNSLKCVVPKQEFEFIKEEVNEDSTNSSFLENEEFSVIMIKNEATRTEPETFIPEILVNPIVDDRTSFEDNVVVNEYLRNETNTENLLLENAEFSIITIENETIKTEPETTDFETQTYKIINDQPWIEGESTEVTETNTENLFENELPVLNVVMEKRHACDFCEKTFPNLSTLKIHLRSHTGEKPFTCTECNRCFTVKHALKYHMKRHAGEKPFSCTECHKSFTAKHALKYHMRRHTGEKPFSCTECDKNFTVKHALERHMKRHTGEKPYKCVECDQGFTAKHSFYNHMARHTGEKPYTCTECSKNFSNKSALYYHMLRHNSENLHVCKDCGKHFIRPINVQDPSKIRVNPLSCDQCEQKSKTNKDTASSKSNYENEFQEDIFQCKECKASYATVEELDTHYGMGVHIDNSDLLYHKENGRTDCVICDKEFNSITTLNSHILEIHKDRSEVFHNAKQDPKLALNHSDTSLTKIYRIDDFNENAVENITTINNVEDKETCILTLENESIKTEPEHFVPHNLVGAVIDNRTSVECGVTKPLLKEVNEKSTNSLLAQNEGSSNITIVNKIIKAESATAFSQTVTGAIKDDRFMFEGIVVPQEFIKNEVTETTTEQLLLENELSDLNINTEQCHNGEKHFKCTICKQFFDAKDELDIHMRQHTGVKPYPCAECKQCFATKKTLKQHLRRHTGERPYTCTECNSGFISRQSLYDHMSRHTGEKPFKCTECKQCFMRKDGLNRHMVRHTGEKPYECTECKQCFTRKAALKRHMMRHTGEKPYKCTECERDFSLKTSFKNHMARHTGEKTYTCSECKQCFLHKNGLDDHMRRHTGEKPYKCTECKQCFGRKTGLKRHMRRHTGEKPYNCTECKRGFALKSTFRIHMAVHTDEKSYKCSECNAGFATKQRLKIHIRRHTGEKPYTCSECNKSFAASQALNLHMKLHTGEKPHVCNECGKRFLRPFELNHHKKTHLRPFACDQCEKKFNTINKLERHTRIHSSNHICKDTIQEQKFKCLDCEALYATVEELKTHYDTGVHISKYTSSSLKGMKETRLNCEMCTKEFDSVKALNSHILEIHEEQSQSFHTNRIVTNLEESDSNSSLLKTYSIDESNCNRIENVTKTDNNVMLSVKYEEQTSMEDGVIEKEYIINEVTEPSTKKLLLENEMCGTLENEYIKVEPKGTDDDMALL